MSYLLRRSWGSFLRKIGGRNPIWAIASMIASRRSTARGAAPALDYRRLPQLLHASHLVSNSRPVPQYVLIEQIACLIYVNVVRSMKGRERGLQSVLRKPGVSDLYINVARSMQGQEQACKECLRTLNLDVLSVEARKRAVCEYSPRSRLMATSARKKLGIRLNRLHPPSQDRAVDGCHSLRHSGCSGSDSLP